MFFLRKSLFSAMAATLLVFAGVAIASQAEAGTSRAALSQDSYLSLADSISTGEAYLGLAGSSGPIAKIADRRDNHRGDDRYDKRRGNRRGDRRDRPNGRDSDYNHGGKKKNSWAKNPPRRGDNHRDNDRYDKRKGNDRRDKNRRDNDRRGDNRRGKDRRDDDRRDDRRGRR